MRRDLAAVCGVVFVALSVVMLAGPSRAWAAPSAEPLAKAAKAVPTELRTRLKRVEARDKRGDAKAEIAAGRQAMQAALAARSADKPALAKRHEQRALAELILARDLVTLAAAKRRLAASRATVAQLRSSLAAHRKTLKEREEYLVLIRVSRQ